MTPSELQSWIGAFGGRRFLLTVGAGIVHTLLLVCGILSEPSYVQLTLATVGIYISASTVQKWKEANGAKAP